LYAGGNIFIGGGALGNRVAKWDGNSWTGLGTQFNDRVLALEVFDDGNGPLLYAAGSFTSISGQTIRHIAKWNGSNWVPLGNSPGGDIGGPFASMRALEVFDDGSGPALYAAGQAFTIPGVPGEHRVAKWDGTEWTPLAQGIDNSIVSAMKTFDDGTGEALFVAGSYLQQPDRPGRMLSKWTGNDWVSLPDEPNNTVFALSVFDPGDGPRLYASGGLSAVGAQPTSFLAGWNGSDWQTFSGANDIVWTTLGFDDGSGPALYAGGNFTTIGDGVEVSRVARFSCDAPCVGDIADSNGTLGSTDGVVDFGDLLALFGLAGPCPGGVPSCTGDIADSNGTLGNSDGVVDFGDLLALFGLAGPC
jgi:trimeric autotransporter adhesin